MLITPTCKTKNSKVSPNSIFNVWKVRRKVWGKWGIVICSLLWKDWYRWLLYKVMRLRRGLKGKIRVGASLVQRGRLWIRYKIRDPIGWINRNIMWRCGKMTKIREEKYQTVNKDTLEMERKAEKECRKYQLNQTK